LGKYVILFFKPSLPQGCATLVIYPIAAGIEKIVLETRLNLKQKGQISYIKLFAVK